MKSDPKPVEPAVTQEEKSEHIEEKVPIKEDKVPNEEEIPPSSQEDLPVEEEKEPSFEKKEEVLIGEANKLANSDKAGETEQMAVEEPVVGQAENEGDEPQGKYTRSF